MNMQRRTNRSASRPNTVDRRQVTPPSTDDLLPWADPYILDLMREHERQTRNEQKQQ